METYQDTIICIENDPIDDWNEFCMPLNPPPRIQPSELLLTLIDRIETKENKNVNY